MTRGGTTLLNGSNLLQARYVVNATVACAGRSWCAFHNVPWTSSSAPQSPAWWLFSCRCRPSALFVRLVRRLSSRGP
jgi:hypothetical protein